MPTFDHRDRRTLALMWRGLTGTVTVDLFLDPGEASRRADAIWTAAAARAHQRLVVRRHYGPDDARAAALGIASRPTAVFFDAAGRDSGTRLTVVPAGYVFQTVVAHVRYLSVSDRQVPALLAPVLPRLTRPIVVRVEASANCPYCPHAIRVAERWAAAAPDRVRTLVVDGLAVPGHGEGLPRVSMTDGAETWRAEWSGVLPEREWVARLLPVLDLS